MNRLDPLAVGLRGVHLVEASAGTGKTHAITTLVVRAVLEDGLELSRILIVTFTNAATAELRERVRARLDAARRGLEDPTAVDPQDTLLRALLERRRAAGTAAADRERLTLALYGFDEAAIFTIHGFCQRVLQELAFESGVRFDTELFGDARAMLVDVVRDFRATHWFAASPTLLDQLKKADSRRLVDIAQQYVRHPALRVLREPDAAELGDADAQAARAIVQAVGPYVADALARRKAAANVQFYDDLLQSLAAALRAPGGAALAATLRARYPLALIDEFQDTDPTQFEIFAQLYAGGGGALFMIGDPKQAIYAFRGADVFTYFQAADAAGAGHTLLTNWRSSPPLIEAVNRIFAVPNAFTLARIQFEPASPAPGAADRLVGSAALRVRLATAGVFDVHERKNAPPLYTPNDARHPFFEVLADEVVDVLDGVSFAATEAAPARRVLPGDVAILSRTNKQLHMVQAALRRAGVTSVLLGDASVFESEEAEMMERVLRALAEPGNSGAVRAALATRLLGRDSTAIAPQGDGAVAWETAMTRFQDWSTRWRTGGFTNAFRAMLDEEDVPARLLGQVGGERALTNLFHLGELLQRAAGVERRGPLMLLEWLRRMRLDETVRGEQASEAAQIRLESDVRALKLTTVHKSKGLEYPVVFCPFLWGVGKSHNDVPLFHGGDGGLTLDLGWPARRASRDRREEEELAEATRVAYVALTRAQQLAVVLWGRFAGFQRSALARLLHGRGRSADAVGKMTDDEVVADLTALAAQAPGAIEVGLLQAPRQRRYTAARETPPLLHAPPPPWRVAQPWRVSSFTALAAGGEALGLRAEEGLDRDEAAAPADALVAAAELEGLPRGRRLGTLIHRVFELIDFTAADAAAIRAVALPLVRAARLEVGVVDKLCRAVADVLDTPLDAAGTLRLRAVAAARRLNEMEFAFPVALDVGGRPRVGVTPERLAAVLAGAASEATRAYAARLARLPFRTLAGYLRGFIDLVFEHDGRWYVVDYKSNDLGARAADYAPASLSAAMAQHDYVLQAHLYAVAVHRYLRRRVRGYDYARDFGGIYYLFVRGMAPGRGPATGVAFEHPSPQLIAALDALLAGAVA
ncbi:MAG: UvrD-helicase domain-containing protein [Deltaproteobacteria bacterium]|nr:UvrD-helicase domain-containing protein [Deltaproteobacteria bacterium]